MRYLRILGNFDIKRLFMVIVFYLDWFYGVYNMILVYKDLEEEKLYLIEFLYWFNCCWRIYYRVFVY